MTQFVSHTNSYISHSGFPKMGTSSLHAYFKCGGLKSTHYYCNDDNTIPNKDRLCVSCIKESVKAGLPPLTQCDNADMYAQLDDGVYFPQIELLEDIVQEYPNATFFLTFRNMEKWYNSLLNWPPKKTQSGGLSMVDRLRKGAITDGPTTSTQEEFSEWYCKHVQRVRDIVSQHSSHTLVEVDIEDPTVGQYMEDIFGIRKSCWGRMNANTMLNQMS